MLGRRLGPRCKEAVKWQCAVGAEPMTDHREVVLIFVNSDKDDKTEETLELTIDFLGGEGPLEEGDTPGEEETDEEKEDTGGEIAMPAEEEG